MEHENSGLINAGDIMHDIIKTIEKKFKPKSAPKTSQTPIKWMDLPEIIPKFNIGK